MKTPLFRVLSVLFCAFFFAVPAFAATYDFSNLGMASGGFKPQGNRFLVSDKFTQNSTSMHYNSANASETGMVIKPNGTNLASFVLGNLSVSSPFGARTVSITITADLKGGGTTSQSVANYSLGGASTSLTAMGMNFSLFDDVTELRIDLTMSGGMVLDIDFNTITITDEQAPGTPTTQATNLTPASQGTASINVYWQNGDGSNRLVFVKAGNSGTPAVTDGTIYHTDADFTAAADIGGGWKCVYNGPERFARISGLATGTEYRLVVYEFNGKNGRENYLTTVGTNVINHSTDPADLAKYDFSGLGMASGGFKPQGNRFLVSDQFSQDGTKIYYNSGAETVAGIVIKPDGTNLQSFTNICKNM